MPYKNNPHLSDLPIHCSEIEATAKLGDRFDLASHTDTLPGFNDSRYNSLAHRARPSTYGERGSMRTLGVSDLLRYRVFGYVGLHPRVTQIIPIENIDALLNVAVKIVDPDGRCAYENPDLLMEAQGTAPERKKLYPPEYLLRIGNILCDLRSSQILTPVCRPGEKPPKPNKIETRVSSLGEENNDVRAVATLYQPDKACEPKLYVEEYSNVDDGTPSRKTVKFCERATNPYNIPLEVVDDPNWRQQL